MNELYRKIPKVDILMEQPILKELAVSYGRKAVAEVIREKTDSLRGILRAAASKAEAEEPFNECLENLEDDIVKTLRKKEDSGFKRVINATGTILHTNLGRAPIAEEHAQKIAELVCGYSNLEYNLEQGRRGERYSHFERLLCEVTGAESAMAVNNNAGAVLLTLSALAAGKEVIVSRGEQIEIGGKFRIPDVIRQGGAKLCEVGATNKTHIWDYEDAVCEETGLLLKVHTSNYRIVGFSENVSTKEMAELASKKGIPFVEDLGSGILVDLRRFGISHDPTVQEVLAAGADVVCFSGDKLLGGPQAGIIAGKKEYIDRIKKHPLTRALRIDKFTAASLELIFRDYYRLSTQELFEKVPVLRMFASTEAEQMERAERLAQAWKSFASDAYQICAKPMEAQMGGGTLPLYQFKGAGVSVIPCSPEAGSIDALEEAFRSLPCPIIGRIQDGQYQIHMQTVFEKDMDELIAAGEKILR